MKFKTIIIDDELYSRENISSELTAYDHIIEIIGEAHNVESAVELIDELKPNLIFLDINLGDGTGFDVLNQIKHEDYKLVFLTAYDQYAIKAFKFNALDYLLKPLNKTELESVMQKVVSIEFKQHALVQNLMQNIKINRPKKVAIPSQDGFSLYELDEIIRCQSDGNYTLIFFSNASKVLSSKTLKYFDDLFEGLGFERIHNSHLVNINHIKKYINLDGGFLKMSDESEVPISQRKKAQVLASLERL